MIRLCSADHLASKSSYGRCAPGDLSQPIDKFGALHYEGTSYSNDWLGFMFLFSCTYIYGWVQDSNLTPSLLQHTTTYRENQTKCVFAFCRFLMTRNLTNWPSLTKLVFNHYLNYVKNTQCNVKVCMQSLISAWGILTCAGCAGYNSLASLLWLWSITTSGKTSFINWTKTSKWSKVNGRIIYRSKYSRMLWSTVKEQLMCLYSVYVIEISQNLV